MSENVLNREFRESDVKRIRNLVKKKYNDSTTIGVGYSVKEEKHKEGDTWTENEKQWIIKNGIKQNITKLDKAKNLYITPVFCPKCKKVMNNRNDKDFYKIHNMCFNCVIEMETRLKHEGKWEEYEKSIQNDEINNKIIDFKLWVESSLNESNNYFSEEGRMDEWKGNLNKEQINSYTGSVIEYLENLKK